MDNLVGAASHRERAQENRKGCSRGRQREAVCKVVLKRKMFACYRLGNR